MFRTRPPVDRTKVIARLEKARAKTAQEISAREDATSNLERLSTKWDRSTPYSLSRIHTHLSFWKNIRKYIWADANIEDQKKDEDKFLDESIDLIKWDLVQTDKETASAINRLNSTPSPHASAFRLAHQVEQSFNLVFQNIQFVYQNAAWAAAEKRKEVMSSNYRNERFETVEAFRAAEEKHFRAREWCDFYLAEVARGLEHVKSSAIAAYEGYAVAMKGQVSSAEMQSLMSTSSGGLMASHLQERANKILPQFTFLFLGSYVYDNLSNIENQLSQLEADSRKKLFDIERMKDPHIAFMARINQQIQDLAEQSFENQIERDPSLKEFLDKAKSYYADVEYTRSIPFPELRDKVIESEKKFFKRAFVTAAIGAAAYVGFQMWDKDEPVAPPSSPPPVTSPYELSSPVAAPASRGP